MDPAVKYVKRICELYGDSFDDREEDAAPGGESWVPGEKARHKSLVAFQRELAEMGIQMSTMKIRKILITGGCWSTRSSREAAELLERFTLAEKLGGNGMDEATARERIAVEMGISSALVGALLPYKRVVYDLEEKTSNAFRCDKWRKKKGT